MAAERGHARLAHLLEGPPPALLELIARVVDAAARAGRHVAVCGELAGQPDGAALLTGLGVRELSMAATRIPEVKQTIRSLDGTAAGRTAQEARNAGSGERVAELGRGLLAAPAGATG
jgi:phosphoenolpyruvate-protein kinase (PTS system EI component)